MRTIKFRAWNKKLKIMQKVPLISFGLDCIEVDEPDMELDFDDCVLMQYIVTEDDNEIYEADIIEEWKHDRLIRTFVANDIRTFTKECDKAESGSIWKIIGNIYENPELTEKINQN